MHLHELAEASGNLETTEADIDQSLDKLQNAKLSARNVSLIEDRLAEEHTESDESQRNTFLALHEAWRLNPPWLRPATPPPTKTQPSPEAKKSAEETDKPIGSTDPASDKGKTKTGQLPSNDSPEGLSELSGDQRCHFVVYMLTAAATEKNDKLHEETFNRQALNWCLNYCSKNDWLELQFLKLLVGEVDWREDSPEHQRKRSLACAATWRLFCELQSLSSNPRAELAWWLRTETQMVDLQFHRAVDMLIGDDYAAALERCNQVQRQMDTLSEKSQKLTQAFDARDEVFWLTPHALSWYLQRYRFL